MNERSLAHSYAQNQQQSSWIGELFNAKGIVKGVKIISHKQNLSNYAEELVNEYGQFNDNQYDLTLSNLPEDEQNELARLYMEFTNRETGECVHGNDFSIDNDYTCALLSMLKNDCKETRETFAEVTRKNIITYYTESLQQVIDDACRELLCNLNDENGMHQHQDYETGEYHWSRY